MVGRGSDNARTILSAFDGLAANVPDIGIASISVFGEGEVIEGNSISAVRENEFTQSELYSQVVGTCEHTMLEPLEREGKWSKFVGISLLHSLHPLIKLRECISNLFVGKQDAFGVPLHEHADPTRMVEVFVCAVD